MGGILEMLAAAEAADDAPAVKVDPGAAMMRLGEAAPRYTRANPFHAGDWVTPIKDSDVKGHGDPHLVIETEAADGLRPPGELHFKRRDLRLLFLCDRPSCQSIHAGWFANADFEWRYYTSRSRKAREVLS
jgi:hypothetical protein